MNHMILANSVFALVLCFFGPVLVDSYTKHVGIEIEASATLREDRQALMRRDRQPGPKTSTTTTVKFATSQLAPNVKLCACNGCLQSNGLCRSIWFTTGYNAHTCKVRRNGTWCVDNRSTLWEAPVSWSTSPSCRESQPSYYEKKILTVLEVKLIPIPSEGRGRVKFLMTNSDNSNSSIALLPCTRDHSQNLLARNGTLVSVQGYYEEKSEAVKNFLAAKEVPTEFKQNASFFFIISVQEITSLESDVQKKVEDQVVTESMAGTLKRHWSAQMSIAVALVSCPGTSLNADPEKVKYAFFTEFALALGAASRGKISVSGNVTEVEIACPADPSKGDVYSYYEAVDSKLKSDSVWKDNQYKAMIIPNGWMATYGLAYSPGYLSWYTDLGGQDAANVMHEIGHNLGLDHAGITPSNNPTGYDANGDCSSAMSKCDSVLFYTLASNWFLGFNTFQQELSVDTLTAPVSFKITSQTQNEASGVLLLKTKNGKAVPAYSVSFLRKADVPANMRYDMDPWLGKVHVHELPDTAYGPTNNVAVLGLNRAFLLRDVSVAVSVSSQNSEWSTVVFCKADSIAEAETCGKR
jgi:hypothetical protein